MAESSVPAKQSKIISGIKYIYLLAFFALLAGVFHPIITDSPIDGMIKGILILFVGLGKTFQVWSPKNFEKFKSFAKKKALQSRSTLKWDNNN